MKRNMGDKPSRSHSILEAPEGGEESGRDRLLHDSSAAYPAARELRPGDGDEPQQKLRRTAEDEDHLYRRQLDRLPTDMRTAFLLQNQGQFLGQNDRGGSASLARLPDSDLDRERKLERLAALKNREEAIRTELALRSRLFAARESSYGGAVADQRAEAEMRRRRLTEIALKGEISDSAMRALSEGRDVNASQQSRIADDIQTQEDEEIRRGEARIASLRRLMLEEEENVRLLLERRRRRQVRSDLDLQHSSRFLQDHGNGQLLGHGPNSISRLFMGDRFQSRADVGGREDQLMRNSFLETNLRHNNSGVVRSEQARAQFKKSDEDEMPTGTSSSYQLARASLKEGGPRNPEASPLAAEAAIAKVSSTGIPLSLPTDKELVSSYQALIRKSLEFFKAQTEDVAWSMQGRKNKILPKQIGVRCRFCAHRASREKGRGSVYFPGKLSGVYQAAQNMTFTHLLESCKDIPPEVREALSEERKNQRIHDKRGGGKKYWIASCKSIGVKEVEGQPGLWLD